MKHKILKTVILIWTVLTIIIDLYAILPTMGPNVINTVSLIMIELLICWIAYKMYTGKNWGLIILTIYYGLKSINIFLDSFSFYSKSGINLELQLGKFFSINLFSLIILVLLISLLTIRTKETPSS
jgi:hypothetical protein